jgi:iron complex transport system ATP-binding protein
MLRTENISFSVGKKQILKNVSASFLPGEFNMILGPNGSGKSSFLKIFSGEINKFQGTVLYDDKKIKELRKEELAKKRAVMSQQADLGFPLLVEEVVMMGRASGQSRAAAMVTIAADWADHYSTAAAYLRLNGILPPSAQPAK